jgi:hypothetical protein
MPDVQDDFIIVTITKKRKGWLIVLAILASLRKTAPSNSKTSRKKNIPAETDPKVSRIHKPEEMGLEEWQTRLRKQFAENQPFRLENIGQHPIFSGLEKLFAAFGGGGKG